VVVVVEASSSRMLLDRVDTAAVAAAWVVLVAVVAVAVAARNSEVGLIRTS
jgi:hypothetical protein